jgi:hypothetical protein
MNYKFLLLDAEYGGVRSKGSFSSDFSILELYLEIVDENMEVYDYLDLKIKPDDGKYIIDPEAMAVTGIDLLKHDKIAVKQSKAKSLLYEFLKKNTDDGKIKLFPSGIGVQGDIRFICDTLISLPSWEKFCSHQTLDLSPVAFLFKAMGKMPQTKKPSTGQWSNSLEALGSYVKADIKNMHSAKKDVEVYKQVL